MESIGKFVTVTFLMVLTSIVNGYVFLKLWGWFVSPTFHVEPLILVEAIGLYLFINFLKMKKEKTETDKEEFWIKIIENTLFVIIMGGFTLLLGWGLHLLF